MHKYDDQGTHLVTLAPPLLSGSIQDNASCDVDTTATPTERGGDGARVAVIPTNGATRACAKHDDRHQPMTKLGSGSTVSKGGSSRRRKRIIAARHRGLRNPTGWSTTLANFTRASGRRKYVPPEVPSAKHSTF